MQSDNYGDPEHRDIIYDQLGTTFSSQVDRQVSYITERTFIRGMQQQENMLEYANDSSQLSEIIKFYTIRLPATMT